MLRFVATRNTVVILECVSNSSDCNGLYLANFICLLPPSVALGVTGIVLSSLVLLGCAALLVLTRLRLDEELIPSLACIAAVNVLSLAFWSVYVAPRDWLSPDASDAQVWIERFLVLGSVATLLFFCAPLVIAYHSKREAIIRRVLWIVLAAVGVIFLVFSVVDLALTRYMPGSSVASNVAADNAAIVQPIFALTLYSISLIVTFIIAFYSVALLQSSRKSSNSGQVVRLLVVTCAILILNAARFAWAVYSIWTYYELFLVDIGYWLVTSFGFRLSFQSKAMADAYYVVVLLLPDCVPNLLLVALMLVNAINARSVRSKSDVPLQSANKYDI